MCWQESLWVSLLQTSFPDDASSPKLGLYIEDVARTQVWNWKLWAHLGHVAPCFCITVSEMWLSFPQNRTTVNTYVFLDLSTVSFYYSLLPSTGQTAIQGQRAAWGHQLGGGKANILGIWEKHPKLVERASHLSYRALSPSMPASLPPLLSLGEQGGLMPRPWPASGPLGALVGHPSSLLVWEPAAEHPGLPVGLLYSTPSPGFK